MLIFTKLTQENLINQEFSVKIYSIPEKHHLGFKDCDDNPHTDN